MHHPDEERSRARPNQMAMFVRVLFTRAMQVHMTVTTAVVHVLVNVNSPSAQRFEHRLQPQQNEH